MGHGFEEVYITDNVYVKQHGFEYTIITKQLTKKIHLRWEKSSRLCYIVRIGSVKEGDIKARHLVKGKEHLDEIIDFFTDK